MRRKEKNMTQEQLAELIPISRTAISKWEREINIPDPTSLGRLREIFEVSVDELFYGERMNHRNKNAINDVSLNLYKSKRKGKKVILGLIFLLIVTLISFLAYYLITNYKSIYVYSINGELEEFNVIEGTFIKTNYKLFFDIQNIEIDNLNSVRLYYVDNNKNEI